MKLLKLTVFFILIAHCCRAQDTTIVLTKAMLDKPTNAIYFNWVNGWIFKQGNDTGFEKINIDTSGWTKLNPVQISSEYADKNGRVECWFRIKIQLDSSLSQKQIGFDFYPYAATELFIDGKLVATRGNIGNNGKPFREYNGGLDPVIVDWQTKSPRLLAIHFVGYVSPMPSRELKVWGGGMVFLTGPNYFNSRSEWLKNNFGIYLLLLSACALLSLLFWLLRFQNKQEKNLVWIAVFTSVLTLTICLMTLRSQTGISYVQNLIYSKLYGLSSFLLVLILLPILLTKVFNRKINKILMLVLVLFVVFNFVGSLLPQWNSFGYIAGVISTTFILVICVYYVVTSWKTLKGAQWAIVFGLIFFISTAVIFITLKAVFKNLAYSQSFQLISLSIFTLSFPFSLLVYVSIRFKEIIREVQLNAKKVIELLEEKKIQAESGQKILQEEVYKQTAELRDTLTNLQSTQAQLIQSEKMASLGELTAGIAHEIQNPLNFVNNFSEVNQELIAEMNVEIEKGNYSEVKEIAKDVSENEEKINHHGKRADAIVKGMLQHRRSSSGVKEPTDINSLCDEYLRLSYHGLRAKDKLFNATTKTDFNNSIGNINIIPQDIGRVVLNLINNAFYAVDEKKKQNVPGYEPTVTIKTAQNPLLGGRGAEVVISVSDNGPGIPQRILDKIFQPFFTTKPTGQGTGLGLSLSYDIIKAHGGELKVETKEGEGSEFLIQLPVN